MAAKIYGVRFSEVVQPSWLKRPHGSPDCRVGAGDASASYSRL